MGRKASTTKIQTTDIDSETLNAATAASGELAVHYRDIAQKFDYQLGYNRDRMVDEIRHYMGESARTMLEAGARLALIRSQEPHGEWEETCGQLNLEPRTAHRMISSALKFSHASTSPHFDRIGTSKLFELLVLDDDDAETLANGGSVDGLGDMDAVGSMTVRELRAALRETREENKAKDTILAAKSKKIDSLQTQLQRKKTETSPEEWVWGPHRRLLLDTCEELASTIETTLRRAMIEIEECGEQTDGGIPETIDLARTQALTSVMQSLVSIQTDFRIEADLESIVTPPWMEEFAAAESPSKKVK